MTYATENETEDMKLWKQTLQSSNLAEGTGDSSDEDEEFSEPPSDESSEEEDDEESVEESYSPLDDSSIPASILQD